MARTKSIKGSSKAERIKKWVDEENARSKELQQRKKDVDDAMAAWAKAADKARRDAGPDVATKPPKKQRVRRPGRPRGGPKK